MRTFSSFGDITSSTCVNDKISIIACLDVKRNNPGDKEENMVVPITIEVWQKGGYCVAKCPELDFISQGTTREEAKKNLLEVIEIQFEEMSTMNTLDEYLAECGYSRNNGAVIQQSEMIGFEKYAIQVA